MKKNYFICAFIFSIGYLQAQNLEPTIISTGGGTHSNHQLTLDWTLGELAVQTIFTNQLLITEGYHQPIFEISNFSEKQLGFSSTLDFEISISPNPLKSFLNISIQSEKDEKVMLSLFNLQGEEQIEKLEKNSNEQFELNLEHLATGIYFLRFNNSEGQEIKTFKLTKIN